MVSDLDLRSELLSLDGCSTDQLYASLAIEAGALGLSDEDEKEPMEVRGKRFLTRLLPIVRAHLCNSRLYKRALEPPLKTPIELAAIAADVLMHSEEMAGLPVCAIGLLVARDFRERLCLN